LAASGGFRAIRAALDERPYHVRVICDAPRKLASAVVTLESVEAVNVDPDGAVVVLSRNVRDLQVELPRLAQAGSIRLRRVEPLDDSLESVFGYLVERQAHGSGLRPHAAPALQPLAARHHDGARGVPRADRRADAERRDRAVRRR